MRILVVGAWQWRFYEEVLTNAFWQLGHEATGVGWASHYWKDLNGPDMKYRSMLHRVDERVLMGPFTLAFNLRLIRKAREFRPQVVFVQNGTHVLPSTLRALRKLQPKATLMQYCNDDPFSASADRLLWRHVKKSISMYDIHFVYRHSNIGHVTSLGGKNVQLLRSYYVPEDDYRQEPGLTNERMRSDVLFAGHFEQDQRLQFLERVAELPIRLNLFGGGWAAAFRHLRPGSPLFRCFPVVPVFGADYRMAISGTKIAIGFLSKLNNDTYTRRNFQIPAMRTFMLNEYSSDLASLFEEGKEAEFFRSQDELLDKIKYYLQHDREREEIALKGHKRVQTDGHDVTARARQVIDVLEKLRNK